MARARQIRGGFSEYGYQAEGGGLRKGVVMVAGADNVHAKIAGAVGAGRFRGVQIDEGTLPDGAADPTLPDTVTAQKVGLAQTLVPAQSSAIEGDQAWSDATGKVVKRVPFSVSGFILGQFDESFTAGVMPEYRSVELYPQLVETVRAFTVVGSGAIGAATRFLGPGFAAPSATPVPVYCARFTGETLRNLALVLKTAPGGTDTVVASFQRSQDGGNTWTDIAGPSAPSVTVTGAATAGADLADSFALTAGDLIAVKLVSSAAVAAQPVVTFDVT